MRYQLYLEEQRKLHARSDKAKKGKAVEDEISEVKCKRKLLKKKHPSCEPRSRQISYRGRSKAQFYFAKSNAFRLKICESEENETKFCDQACGLKRKLKFME